MENKKLNNCARDLMKELSKKFFDASCELESDLIKEIRTYAGDLFFIPFLENFYLYLNEQNKTINSKYFLKILLTSEKVLFHRDILGEVGSSYTHNKKQLFFLKENEDIFIIKGIIVSIIDDLELNDVKEFIKTKTLAKYPTGGPDDLIYIFDFVPISKVIDMIYKEFEEKNIKDKLLKEV